MTQAAAHSSAFNQADGLSITAFVIIVFIPQAVSVGSCLRKHSAFQVLAMTGAAGVRISLVEIHVFLVPRSAVDVMHTMRAIQGKRQAGMTNAAFTDGAGMALQLVGGHIVIGRRQCIGPDRMGGSMAAFAGDTAVSQAVSVERTGVFSKALVVGQTGRGDIDITIPGLCQADASQVADRITGMAGLAAGLINPGFACASATASMLPWQSTQSMPAPPMAPMRHLVTLPGWHW